MALSELMLNRIMGFLQKEQDGLSVPSSEFQGLIHFSEKRHHSIVNEVIEETQRSFLVVGLEQILTEFLRPI